MTLLKMQRNAASRLLSHRPCKGKPFSAACILQQGQTLCYLRVVKRGLARGVQSCMHGEVPHLRSLWHCTVCIQKGLMRKRSASLSSLRSMLRPSHKHGSLVMERYQKGLWLEVCFPNVM